MQHSHESNRSPSRGNPASQTRLLEISREFDVPVDRLFQAFTTPEALKAWWWPKDLHSDRVEIDFREGGRYFINMKGFDSGGGGMTGHFEEIVRNERIVMTDQFADEHGRAITAEEAKMPGEWPAILYITLEFTALNPEKSRLQLAQQGVPNELQKDCTQGWAESFDKLEACLASRKF